MKLTQINRWSYSLDVDVTMRESSIVALIHAQEEVEQLFRKGPPTYGRDWKIDVFATPTRIIPDTGEVVQFLLQVVAS